MRPFFPSRSRELIDQHDVFSAYNLALRIFPNKTTMSTAESFTRIAVEIARILDVPTGEVEVESARDGTRVPRIRVGPTWHTLSTAVHYPEPSAYDSEP